MCTTLHFRGGEKLKKTSRDIYRRTSDIEFERDWLVSLGPALGDEKKKLKNIFQVSGIFPGKFASITLLGFECKLLLIHTI